MSFFLFVLYFLVIFYLLYYYLLFFLIYHYLLLFIRLIYRNSIENNLKLENIQTGNECLIIDYNNNYIGRGFYNHHSIYSIRVIARQYDNGISLTESTLDEILKIKFQNAINLRKLLLLPNKETNIFRLIHGEGDGLSGFIVDIMNNSVVVQSSAYWVEFHRDIIEKQLKLVLEPYLSSINIIWTGVQNRLFADGWFTNKIEGISLFFSICQYLLMNLNFIFKIK